MATIGKRRLGFFVRGWLICCSFEDVFTRLLTYLIIFWHANTAFLHGLTVGPLFTLSAHVRRQSLPVLPPTLSKIRLLMFGSIHFFSGCSGHLFHIDFGYILGRDPKPFPPPMKLSKEMVEAMGGDSSLDYQKFRQHCYNAFLILRRSVKTQPHLDSVIVYSPENHVFSSFTFFFSTILSTLGFFFFFYALAWLDFSIALFHVILPISFSCAFTSFMFRVSSNTVWCSEIGPLTSLDALELHVSSDVREPFIAPGCTVSATTYFHVDVFPPIQCRPLYLL